MSTSYYYLIFVVVWLAVAKNQILALLGKQKLDLVHSDQLCCTIAMRPVPTMLLIQID